MDMIVIIFKTNRLKQPYWCLSLFCMISPKSVVDTDKRAIS